MATKSADILAYVEPEVKEQAEKILSELGISASVVISSKEVPIKFNWQIAQNVLKVILRRNM